MEVYACNLHSVVAGFHASFFFFKATLELDYIPPPLRMKCGETQDEYKKCEKLDVFAVHCKGEGKKLTLKAQIYYN